ncbi:MAG: class I SAM-dependent methyltransferase [Bacteroidetes bacterium]|nr:class I SAM-dependent methyltransferase [Bacteroidota bacterium]
MKHQNLTQPISFLQQIISNGGPESNQYETLNNVFDTLAEEYKSGRLKHEELVLLQNGFGDECMQNTLHGHIKSKPFGYAGDFMIIDKIYKEQITEDDRFVKWDIFWNKHAASKAVRNRKDYFIKTISDKLSHKTSLQLLDVASGPARDLEEIYKIIPSHQLHTVCIEADKNAIEYAKKLNECNEHEIDFIHKNIFRFSTDQKFDIVWSAGLFDYFNDAIFVKLLRKFISWTASGGEVIIGNFSTQNPSRNYMELIGDWFLEHRSKDHLINLALEAGAEQKNIRVGSEMEGVNLFLHITI